MFFMFKGCSSLKDLDITNFDTKKVDNMSYMFYKCSKELTSKIRAQNNGIREEAFATPVFDEQKI